MTDQLRDFEHLVLLAVLRLGAGAYTVSIIDELHARTNRHCTHAAVYVALRRLEAKGLVNSHLGEPTPERGGRAKRFFRVRPKAMQLLKATREGLLGMWDGLDELGV